MADDTDPIRLLIVDDHPVVRDGLRGMFADDDGFEVVGEAANGTDAIARAQAYRPDVVLMDLRMPGMDGVSAIRQMSAMGIAARVLVLTTFDTDGDVLPAIEAGATGYLLKDAPRDELLRAVRSAAAGEAVLSPSVATRLLDRVRQPVRETVSQRELEASSWSPPGQPTARWPSASSSARRRSRPTSSTSTPSSASTTGRPRSAPPSRGAC